MPARIVADCVSIGGTGNDRGRLRPSPRVWATISFQPRSNPRMLRRCFISHSGSCISRVPPILELVGPLAELRGISSVYDAEKTVELPPLPAGAYEAQLFDSIPAIDPGGVRQQIGLPRCGEGIRVCIVDTGIDAEHPDLRGSVAAWVDLTEEGDGYDNNGHGTHVAGIVAGRGIASSGRYTGVAPAATLLAAKVLNGSGLGHQRAIVQGLRWAWEQKADVVNLSLGGPGLTDGQSPESRSCDALVQRGVVVVVSAGNSGPDMGTVSIPGDARDAITVGALSRSGGVCYFSSRGPTSKPGATSAKPDLLAPGDQVISCRSSRSNPDLWRPIPGAESYAVASGTSMAAPMATGVSAVLLAWVKSKGDVIPPLEVKRTLLGTCRALRNEPTEAQGRGIVNLSDAIVAVSRTAGIPVFSQPPVGNEAEPAPSGSPPEIFGVDELAAYLRIKPVTIYKHLREGKLPGFKVWRDLAVPEDDELTNGFRVKRNRCWIQRMRNPQASGVGEGK